MALGALAAAADAASGKGKPGYCKDDKDCVDKYTCVSVQTTRDAVTDVKQCLPTAAGNPVCTGTQPGLCPSFSTTWGTSFREISSVCAYIIPEGTGIKCIPAGSGESNNSTKGAVECLFIQNPANPTNQTDQVGVIYGCVDFDGSRLLFQKNSKSDKVASSFNYSEIIAENCVNPKNPQGSTFVCSSQGTCSPNSVNSMSYSCKCNIGFSGKYCEKIVNNKCYNNGVCGGGTCDLTTNECTDCPLGTTGNKCAQCDPTYDSTKVCGGHGKCVVSSGDSTLGADGSSSGTVPTAGSAGSSDSSASAGSASNSTTTTPTTTKKPTSTTSKPSSTSEGSGSGGAGTVSAPNLNRLLQTKSYQCQCDTGYTDTNCG